MLSNTTPKKLKVDSVFNPPSYPSSQNIDIGNRFSALEQEDIGNENWDEWDEAANHLNMEQPPKSTPTPVPIEAAPDPKAKEPVEPRYS